MKVQACGSARWKEVCTATLLPFLLAGCGGIGGVGSNQQAVISDQLHGSGVAGFLWMPPMVPTLPAKFGVFQSGVPATVRIDEVKNGLTVRSLATFTSTSGPEGQKLREHKAHNDRDCGDDDNGDRNNAYYIASWETEDDHLSTSASYRVRVFVPGVGGGTREIGFADLQVARGEKAYRAIDANNFVPLRENGELHVKFRIEKAAVDADNDGKFDWLDNCPNTSNPDQFDTLKSGVGDACRCDKVVCTALDACHTKGVCQGTSGVCTNPLVANGTACTIPNAAATCNTGVCTLSACNAGRADCDKSLANGCETAIDTTTNCGACGVACAAGANATAVCTAGACALSCGAGWADCDGKAANGCELATNGDVSNCGGCGIVCAHEEGCAAGACSTAACQAGYADCDKDAGNGCEVTLATDVSNCGACNNACAFANGSAACTAGACVLRACAAGYANCDGNPGNGCEATPASDVNNCGKCGNACALPNAVPVCTSSACAVASCTTGYADCDGAPSNGCEVSLSDTRNCGGCGTVCTYANAAPLCQKNACALGACNTGFADCDQVAGNGCETIPATDVKNCGACGKACVFGAHSAPSCGASTCGIVCDAGWADCDGNPATGCEVDTTSDIANCGACNNGCKFEETCQASACSATVCVSGYGNCDSSNANGCESTLATDVNNCSSCGNVCSFANAAAKCTAGGCGFSVCNTDYADCDANQADGCEVALLTDVSNCGGCGTTCSFPNAGAFCAAGHCALGGCQGGYANCDANDGNGCETTPASDVKNCGACGNVCPSGPNSTAICAVGVCGIACAPGYADCDGDPSDGCEQSIGDSASNCGGCGNLCTDHTTCQSGACTAATCQAGFGDCNGDPGDGCEVNLATDVGHCGTCATACAYPNAGAMCAASVCAMTTCSSGYNDCNKSSSDGCEDPTSGDVNNCGACGNLCPQPASSTSTCSSSACGYTCTSGYADCNNQVGDGCEINTVSDVGNCGGCNVVCPTAPPHEVASCTSSTCVATCATGYVDCNTKVSDGCEINTTTDGNNCGGCGIVCNNQTTCQNGACSTAVCVSGYADCNNSAIDGCETITTGDIKNCGGCGLACVYGNAGASCRASTCAMGACNQGFADCNNSSSDGCESNTQVDVNNCGGCGVVCAAGWSCVSSVCVGAIIASLELHPTTLSPTTGQSANIGLHVVAKDKGGNVITGVYSTTLALSVTAGSAQTTTLTTTSTYEQNPGNPFLANNPTAVGYDAGHGDTYILATNSCTVDEASGLLGGKVFYAGNGGAGYRDGAAAQASFYYPQAMAVDVVSPGVTNVYVVDKNNGVIRKVSGGIVSTYAGFPCSLCGHGTADGIGAAAHFNDPQGGAIDSNHNVLVADSVNNRVRRVSTVDASVTTLTTAGTFVANPPNPAFFYGTPAVGADASGAIYVSTASGDGGGSLYRVTQAQPRQLLATGHVFTGSIAADSAGTVYAAHLSGQVVYSVSTLGTITRLAGQVNNAGETDGSSQTALLSGPFAVTIDANGTLYVPTNGDGRTRRIATPAALTLAGSSTLGNSTAADGAAVTYAGTGLAPRTVCVSTSGVAPVCATFAPIAP